MLCRALPLLLLFPGGGVPPAEKPKQEIQETGEKPEPSLVAALETEQGAGMERVAVFADGTLVRVMVYQGRRVISRKPLSNNEIDIIRRLAVDASATDAGEMTDSGVTAPGETRRVRIEVTKASTSIATFAFKDHTRLPLALGRMRMALEQMRERFLEKDVSKELLWNPAKVTAGMTLKRRDDGRLFRVARDDSFERNLELEELSRGLERLMLVREELPKLFFEPSPESGPLGKRR